jgi:hypothetical protein
MASSKKLTGSGFAPLQVTSILGDVDNGASNTGITATGTTQATAYAIGAVNSIFSIVASGAGAILPTAIQGGDEFTAVNQGANSLTVYPPLGGTINNGTVNAGVTVSANSMSFFKAVPAANGALTGLNYMSK